MKIKAAVLRAMGAPAPYAKSKPLSIEEVELDPPGPGEVLVKVAAAGLCHSDLSVINGDRPRVMPMVLGHEAAGIVEELGAGVDDLKRGDHVGMVFVPSCGHCLPCAEGRPALCEPGAAANGKGELLGGGRRLKRNGEALNHHMGVSAFAQYATVSRHSLVKIDPEVPLDEAALFGCAVLTGVGAVLNTAAVRPGQSVAVVGLGGVGLTALLGALVAGARTVVAIDLSSRSSASRASSARRTSSMAATRRRRCGEGGDRRRRRCRGRDGGLGQGAGDGLPDHAPRRHDGHRRPAQPAQTMAISPVNLVAEERTLKGSYIGSCVPLRDMPRYIALYRAGKLPVDRLLSDRIKLEDINEGFDRLAEGKAVRQVVVF